MCAGASDFDATVTELRRHEQQISQKSKDIAIIVGMDGSDTSFLYTPGGHTYRKTRALGGAYADEPMPSSKPTRGK